MPDEPWTAEIREVYEAFASDGHELRERDIDYLESVEWTETMLRDAFEEGFLQSANPNSPIFNPDVSPEDRQVIRERVIELVKAMGYDPTGRGWDTWREWIEENS